MSYYVLIGMNYTRNIVSYRYLLKFWLEMILVIQIVSQL